MKSEWRVLDFWLIVVLNVAAVYAIALLENRKDNLIFFSFWVSFLAIGSAECVLALIFLIFPRLRRIGQIMLVASGIILLIGLSVCSKAR